jgi:hypothetical protein
MRWAFKEWAVVVDALGTGRQVVILRKGGIAEDAGNFKLEHSRFLLFPTRFHQQRDEVIPEARERFDRIAPAFPPPDRVRIEYFAELTMAGRLRQLREAESLRGQHIWTDDLIAKRFEWGSDKVIWALAVRVFRLPAAIGMALLPEYSGCKSWVELSQEIPIEGAVPVFSESAFNNKLGEFRRALADVGAGSHMRDFQESAA